MEIWIDEALLVRTLLVAGFSAAGDGGNGSELAGAGLGLETSWT